MFILVHGAYHGAWCWQPVIERLQAMGQSAHAPNLPGHGQIDTWIGDQNMTNYVEAVVSAIDNADQPIDLVGHSMAGAVVAAAAEKRPDALKKLIFLSAYIPANGETLRDSVRSDPASLVQAEQVDVGGIASIMLKTGTLAEAFYSDATPEQLAWAEDRVQLQSTEPFFSPITLSERHFGRVSKAAIICMQDKAISPSHQRWMAERAGCASIVTMDTGHSAFATAPDMLADVLIQLSRDAEIQQDGTAFKRGNPEHR